MIERVLNGRTITAAALLVTAPRLMLAFAAEQQLTVPGWVLALLTWTTAGGTAAAVTLGQVYLAHRMATSSRHRRALAAMWIATLAGATLIIALHIAAEIAGATLYQAVRLPWLHEHWLLLLVAAVHVLVPETIAAAALVADAGRERAQQDRVQRAQHRARPRSGARRAPAAPAQSTGPSAVVSCSLGCGRGFGSDRAERAHRRHCTLANSAEVAA